MGSRCDSFRVTFGASYTSEFVRLCEMGATSTVSQRTAYDRCAAFEEGWSLATVGTSDVYAELTRRAEHMAQSDPEAGAWLAGSSDASGVWRWGAGRLNGLAFASSNPAMTCLRYEFIGANRYADAPFDVCRWSNAAAASSLLFLAASSTTPSQALGGAAANELRRCYVCERSLCANGPDCFDGHTAAVAGYSIAAASAGKAIVGGSAFQRSLRS